MKHIDLPSAAEVVERLKHAYGVTSDTQLARKVGVAQTTVSTWRNKGPVPYEACVLAASEGVASLNELIFGFRRAGVEDTHEISKSVFKIGIEDALRDHGIDPDDYPGLIDKVAIFGRARIMESRILMEDRKLSLAEVTDFFRKRTNEMYGVGGASKSPNAAD